MVGTATEEELDLALFEGLDQRPRCESLTCKNYHRGEHEADWMVNYSCGPGRYWCNWRLERYMREGYFICILHHGAEHHVASVMPL